MEEQKSIPSQIISEEEVKKVADLARLDLTAEEVSTFPSQLSAILGHIDKLSNLPTDSIDAKPENSKGESMLREDVVRENFFNGDLLSNAPQKKETFFKVPKVIE